MKQLNELVASVINVPAAELTLQSGPENISKWDSLAHIGIIAAVEQTYNFQLTTAEIIGIKCVNDLCNVIENHGVSIEDDAQSL